MDKSKNTFHSDNDCESIVEKEAKCFSSIGINTNSNFGYSSNKDDNKQQKINLNNDFNQGDDLIKDYDDKKYKTFSKNNNSSSIFKQIKKSENKKSKEKKLIKEMIPLKVNFSVKKISEISNEKVKNTIKLLSFKKKEEASEKIVKILPVRKKSLEIFTQNDFERDFIEKNKMNSNINAFKFNILMKNKTNKLIIETNKFEDFSKKKPLCNTTKTIFESNKTKIQTNLNSNVHTRNLTLKSPNQSQYTYSTINNENTENSKNLFFFPNLKHSHSITIQNNSNPGFSSLFSKETKEKPFRLSKEEFKKLDILKIFKEFNDTGCLSTFFHGDQKFKNLKNFFKKKCIEINK
jgi:hypothetical protein